MLNTGLLVRFIPEFRSIINRIQYDEYHLYPVDKHLLRTVQTVKNFGTAKDSSLEPLCGQIYAELKDKKPLLWAALLHDIGKGQAEEGHGESGAAMSKKLLTRKGLGSEVVDSVAFLVREHLLLIKTATRRDIYDEETALNAARKIKDIERLKMLYLLTVADSIATGPMAWNQWKAALLRSFFLKVLNVLDKGELATTAAVAIVEQKKTEIIAAAGSKKAKKHITALIEVMSPRYLLYMPADEITEHINLFDQLGDNEFIWGIKRSSDANTRTVTICAQDRPGLISKIAGVFTLHNIDILDVQAFTWRNDIALDIFAVKPPPDEIMEDEKWKRTAKKLGDVLSDGINLASALKKKVPVLGQFGQRVSRKPHRVRVDNKSSSFFTIIEVFTYDAPGLLFSITDALFRCGLNIWVAKIATKADQVVDVFYVTDRHGQKIEDESQLSQISDALLAAIDVTVDP